LGIWTQEPQHRLDQHRPLQRGVVRLRQVTLEDNAPGVPVRHPVKARRRNQQTQVQRVHPLPEHALPHVSVQQAAQDVQDGRVERRDYAELPGMLGFMDVRHRDQPHPIRMRRMIVERALH